MWKAFAEHFKECGRNGTLFVFALPVVILAVLATSWMGRFGTTTLWLVWTGLLLRATVKFVHEWRHPARLGKFPPLPQNDLSRARSKLMKYRNQHPG